MYCTAAAYSSAPVARSERRRITREYRYRPTVNYCERCDAYHLCEDSKYPFDPRWKEVLVMLAQGFSSTDIAKTLRRLPPGSRNDGPLRDKRYTGPMKTTSVDTIIRRMMHHFYALSRANLVAITISLGIIDPNKFVPGVKTHA
jgi:hypothetical protein